ncbi:MAG: hypothetical protein QNJ60_15975 [Xenococcaceae cyanobacterium MO_188.B19]|nr:hypothetical protein [Xenococcaceae cyanobacterium MO_188.B19]
MLDLLDMMVILPRTPAKIPEYLAGVRNSLIIFSLIVGQIWLFSN